MLGLLIPDAHCNQDQDVSRFKNVGKLIVKRRPDFIMLMGDFVGMHALSHWDRNKKLKMEGRRYIADIAKGNEALDYLFRPLVELQMKQVEEKKKIYKPDKYYLGGNHEEWATKYLEENPMLEGFLDPIKDLQLLKRNFNIIPYKEYIEIGGIQFTHVPMKGGQPVQGQYVMARAFEVTATSMIFGHTHRCESMNGRRLGNDKLIQLLTTGCFFEEEYEEDFLKGCPNPYWRGVFLIHIFRPGRFDIEQIALERILDGDF